MAPPRKISHSCSAGTLPTFTQLHVGGDGLLLVPPPSRPPSAHQGYAHIPHGTGLIRVWVEVRSGSVHIYPHEAASLPSMVVQLDHCDITLSRDITTPPHCVRVSLKGLDQLLLYLDTEEEAESWFGMLRVTAAQRSLQLEGLNLECGAAGEPDSSLSGRVEEEEEEAVGGSIDTLKEGNELDEEEMEEDDEVAELTREALDSFLDLLNPYYCEEEDTGSGDSCETESQEEEEGGRRDEDDEGSLRSMNEGVRIRHPRRPSSSHGRRKDEEGRRELLQQMLATKSLLEKKQKNRRSGVGAWAVTAGEVVNEYDRAQHQAQQSALRRAVILRQRKNSTAIKMATLERQQSSKKKPKQREERDVSAQLEALRRRLSCLDSQLRESAQDTERTLQDLENKRNQELHLIKDLGGVDQGLQGGLGGLPLDVGGEERPLAKSSQSNSLMGSLTSLPSIVVSSGEKSEKKTPEKIFGFKVGGRDGKLKGRNPLHFLDLKLRVSRRHKSTENLAPPAHTTHQQRPLTPTHISHSTTSALGSCSDNSSDEEQEQPQPEQQQQQQQQQQQSPFTPYSQPPSTPQANTPRTEISKEALQEIEAFKQLIERYFATHPRHDSITQREILL